MRRSAHLGERVTPLVDGALRADERDELLGHVARCAPCKVALDEERQVKAAVGRTTLSPSPELLGRLSSLAAPGQPLAPRRAAMPLAPGPRPTPAPAPRHALDDRAAPGEAISRGRAARRWGLVASGAAAAAVTGLVGTAYAVAGPLDQPTPVVTPDPQRLAADHALTTNGLPFGAPPVDAVPRVAVASDGVLGTRPPEAAGDVPEPGPAPMSDPSAVVLLQRAAAAASTTAYAGTTFMTGWGREGSVTRLVDVVHVPGEGTVYLVRGAGNDTAGRAGSGADVTRAGFLPDGSSVAPADVDELADAYSLEMAGRSEVVGRAATVVEARGDTDRLAARFWLDDATGLTLRREAYDDDGGVARAFAFVSIDLGRAEAAHLPPAVLTDAGSSVRGDDLVALKRDGWACPDSLPDGLRLVDARRGDAGVHLTFSDGLSTVSVFQQRGGLDMSAASGFRPETWGDQRVWMREGMPDQVVWSAHGTVWTVVADAPYDVVEAAVAALPSGGDEPAEESVADRVGRGLVRVGSWFDATS